MGTYPRGCASSTAFTLKHSIDATIESGIYFRGALKGILVQKESHFLEVCRYVVLNPVRAKAVEHPRVWAWSSYRATGGLASIPRCLTVDEFLNILVRGAARRSRNTGAT